MLNQPRRIGLARAGVAALIPFALALAGCGSESESAEGALSGEPVEAIAAPDGAEWAQTSAVTDMGGVRLGNPDAPIKLVEYASHTCPHCATFAENSAEGIENYVNTGVVSYELRNQIHDPIDLTIAMLARCGDASTFHPLARQAWQDLGTIVQTAQADPEALQAAAQAPEAERFQRIGEVSGLIDWFAARGISRDQAMQCLSQPDTAAQIVERSTQQSDELEVTGTPTFFINGSKLDASSWAEVEGALQRAGAR